jgi:hypothetical protein
MAFDNEILESMGERMFNILNCNKLEIVGRAKYRCSHGHNGITHPKCFDSKDGKGEERVAFLDIEAESLDADFGIVFCWVIQDLQGRVQYDVLTKADIANGKTGDPHAQPKEDKRLMVSLIEALKGYDRVVAHYGCGYDLPFVRTRSLINGLEFPAYGELFQSDTWVYLKKKFKLSRNSLENGVNVLLGKSKKTRLSLSQRHGCLRGEPWAMAYTLDHCKKDVSDLVDLYKKIHMFSRKTKSSI